MRDRSFWRIVSISLVMLHAPAPLALSSTDSISGTVKDSEGAVIGGARVTVHMDSGVSGLKDRPDTVVLSDKKGHFTLEVGPGFYDIFASAPVFSPQCTKVRVHQGESAGYTPQLSADPLGVKERGDAF